ncbi:BTB/POZ domain-containing protein KCTD14 [Microtus ochrogaster]|uniref:BTB/POZ domain-containing protein KCTD14 n=1 Tax=Microtus ochrogaster TaxID=79684 RepID=A0ABM1UE11_MICOH|nr:BTB/POZ domain-containing protein KCTD14 [Microtus ochrogaster]
MPLEASGLKAAEPGLGILPQARGKEDPVTDKGMQHFEFFCDQSTNQEEITRTRFQIMPQPLPCYTGREQNTEADRDCQNTETQWQSQRMSLPANQLKELSQESLPSNQLKERSQESGILGFDPDIVVELNVGGQFYTTTMGTLMKHPGSKFSEILSRSDTPQGLTSSSAPPASGFDSVPPSGRSRTSVSAGAKAAGWPGSRASGSGLSILEPQCLVGSRRSLG